MALSIGRFSVRNTVFLNILMVTILVLGFFSLSRLPQEQFAEVPFFWVNIIVPYPGVSAEDIEKTVTVEIEKEFQGLDNLKEIESSTSEGVAVIQVEFEDGISNQEFERLYQEVSTRTGNVELPEGTLNPIVDDFSSSDFLPVIEVVLSGDTSYAGLERTSRLLYDRLLSIRDVSKIDLVGSRERRVLVDASRRRLEALGLTLDEMIRAIQQHNVTVPGGTLESRSREYLIRTIGEIEEIGELEDIVVRRSGGERAGIVRVGDVARVAEDFDPRGVRARFNGEQAIVLRVAKTPRTGSVGVVRAVKDEVASFEETLPAGLSISLLNDSTVQIRDSLDILVNNAVLGLLLLLVILFVFIGFRNALMTAIGIPLTFAITFVVLELIGETLNTNTLFALVLVLGLIVDHAIVIIENSYRLQQGGLSRTEAAVKGTGEVVVPVIAATLTTVAAFLPLMILPGTIGKFLRIIPLVVSIALAASTFEAIVFIPAHFAEWPGKARERGKRIYERVRVVFERFLSRVYRRRGIAVALMFAVMIVVLFLVTTVDQNLFNSEDSTYFYINVDLPTGASRSATGGVVRKFEERIIPLIGNGEIAALTSTVGLSAGQTGNTAKSNVAQLTVDITESGEGRERSITAIMQEIQQLCSDISGAERVQYRKVQGGPPVDPPVSFRLFGDDYDELLAVSRAIEDKLATYPELLNIRDNIDQGTPELRVRIKQGVAARYGLSTAAIGSFIRASFEGVTATTVFLDNEELDVTVQYAHPPIMTARSLVQMKIPGPDGRQIPFSAVCTVDEGSSIASIKRLDEKREVTVVADAYDESGVPEINREVEAMFAAEFQPRFPGIELKTGGAFTEFNNLLGQILRIFLIGVFLIYIILGTQFRSYTQPVLILFTIPFAFVGVVLFLIVSGTPFSTTVLYAGVALAGIAVNDSIVLISFINDQLKQDMPIREAVITAAGTRLRPIFLTSITTIAGLTPTALALGGESVVWGPMASTIIFGLLFSTVTTLVFIPCLYGLLYDRKKGGGVKHAAGAA